MPKGSDEGDSPKKKGKEKDKERKKSPDKHNKIPDKDKERKKTPDKDKERKMSFFGGKKPKKEEAEAEDTQAGDAAAAEPSPTRKKSIFSMSRPKTPPEHNTEKRKGSIFGGMSRPKTPPGEKGKGGGMFGGLGRRMSRFIPGASASADISPQVDTIEEGSEHSDSKSKSSERSLKPREMIANLKTEFFEWLLDNRQEYANVKVMSALAELEDFTRLLWPLCKDKGLTQEERFLQLVEPVDQVYHPKNITRRFLDKQFWPEVWVGSEEHIRQDIASVMISRALRMYVCQLRMAQAREQGRLDAQAYQESVWAKIRLKREIERIRRVVCRDIAEDMAKEGIRVMRMPSACLRLQCFWRGCRVRIRMPRYRAWVLRRRQWLLEQERVRYALEQINKIRAAYWEQEAIRLRRKWGREEFDHSGWHPDYKADQDYNIFDFANHPPRGSQFGVRTHKVKLPPDTKKAYLDATDNENTWVGIPVKVVPRRAPQPKQYGPALRMTQHDPGEMPKFYATRNTERTQKQKDNDAKAKSKTRLDGSDIPGHYDVHYSWLPAPLVADAVVDAYAERGGAEAFPDKAGQAMVPLRGTVPATAPQLTQGLETLGSTTTDDDSSAVTTSTHTSTTRASTQAGR